MQIQLQQPEIIEGLKQYISNQGINLNGKTFSVKFTAGRNNSGTSAEITIESTSELPELVSEDGDNKTAPALTVVTSNEKPANPEKTDIEKAADQAASTGEPEGADTKTKSLFG